MEREQANWMNGNKKAANELRLQLSLIFFNHPFSPVASLGIGVHPEY